MGVFQSGQMGQTVNLLSFDFGGSNPSAPTLKRSFAESRASRMQKLVSAEAKSRCRFCGNSSVDRALAFQAGGRGFEPRFPLKVAITREQKVRFLPSKSNFAL